MTLQIRNNFTSLQIRKSDSSFLSKVMQDTSGPLWEIEFCKSVRVPWQKVVTAKKFLHCHESVIKWDDSAGEEAFHKAKRRYWEKINGLPCETPLPDQDIYIDEIDWKPKIDSRLILDLDREYFNPDETERNEKSESIIKEVDKADLACDPDNDSNPWERGSSQRVATVKGAFSNWGQYEKSINLKNVNNPWERSCSEAVESLKNNSWKRCADESLSWNREPKYNKQSSDANIITDNSWGRGSRIVGYEREKGWRPNDWNRGRKQWDISGNETQRPGNTVHTRQNNFASHGGAPWNKGYRGWEENRLENNDFRGNSLSGCRKREGSFQHRPRYKTSRFQGDNQETPQQWQKENNQKTVGFYI